MKIGVVGGGVLGLTLSHRLSRMGHEVELFETSPILGGLACPAEYAGFTWDRFYHCILPQDQKLLSLLGELGLEKDLRWSTTGTGYYSRGRFYSMSSNADFLRFPLLSFLDKARMGAAILYATRLADPQKLYKVTARDWLRKICGKRNYEVFWQPLLKAKLGSFHDQVSAVFIWATLKRLFGARSGTANKEKLGYVSGGYRRILESFREALSKEGATLHLGSPVKRIETLLDPASGKKLCRITFLKGGERASSAQFDQVFFTAPARLARGVISADLLPHVERLEKDFPTSGAYLGVICLVLVLKKALTPYYVLNIGDESVELTGLIEMTNLIDRERETAGRSLVYLPRYVGSDDPLLEEPDASVAPPFIDRGLKRLFPEFKEDEIVLRCVHRARYVQPLPLARDGSSAPASVPTESALDSRPAPEMESPFQMLSTFMLQCATLNNNEVVGLVNEFLEKNKERL
jgi:protoporphyrinogen oxidase